MIAAVLNPKGGFRKTALVLRLVRLLARQGKRVTLIDRGPQGSALHWSERCARRRFDHLFGVIGLARNALHREASQLARHADHIGIDGPPRVATLPRSALLTADLALIAAQPSTFDRWVSEEMLALIAEARIFCPPLTARFALNRSPARAVITRATRHSLSEHGPTALAAQIGRCVIFADAAHAGRLAFEHEEVVRNHRARSRDRRASGMTTRDRHGRFLARPGDAESWVKISDPGSSSGSTGTICTARLTGDVTPNLRERINIAAFQRVGTVAYWLRDLPACESSDAVGDRL
jgi:chromosome partitioning protein